MNDRQGSTTDRTQTKPSVTPSRSAISRARASFEVPERWVLAPARYSTGRAATAASEAI